MNNLLLIALGGAIGAVTRYKIADLILQQTIDWKFPAGTFAVNLLGCLIAGILTAVGEKTNAFTPELRLLLFTGFLGGFTTFSAFGLETVNLLRRGEISIAISYAVLSVVVGVLVLWGAIVSLNFE